MEIKAKIVAGKLDKNRYAFAIPDGDKLKWVSAFLKDGKYEPLDEAFNESLRSIEKDDWVKMEVEENKGFLNIKKIEKIESLTETKKGFLKDMGIEKTEKKDISMERYKQTKEDYENSQKCIVAQSSLKEAVNTVGLFERLQLTNDEILSQIFNIWQLLYDEVWKKIK